MPEMTDAPLANATESSRYRPSMLATPFVRSGYGEVVELLSSVEQEALARISQLMRIKKRMTLYPEGGDARFVYNVIEGVVGTWHLLPGGERLVTAFLFPGDLLGMSENGKYVATAQTISPVVAYRIAMADLESVLQWDPQARHRFAHEAVPRYPERASSYPRLFGWPKTAAEGRHTATSTFSRAGRRLKKTSDRPSPPRRSIPARPGPNDRAK